MDRLTWPGVWPGVGSRLQLLADPVIALDEVGAAGLHDGPHAVGDDRPVLVAVELRPVLPLRPREEIAGARKGRDPAAIVEARACPTCVGVQVRAEREVDGLGRASRRRQGGRESPSGACAIPGSAAACRCRRRCRRSR